jgi:hypothetical protein
MYSNDYNQIRAGLTNYIGAMIKACPYEGVKASRQYVAATLIEEAMQIIEGDSVTPDMYVAKPLLRANIIVLKKRILELQKLPQVAQVKEKIEQYNNTIELLNELVNNTNE